MEVTVGPHGWGYGGGWGKRGEWMALWVLVMVAEGPVHGYEILTRLREAGIPLNPGTLYRTLRTLEAQGLVESRWVMCGGPARRLYRITPQGWAHLRELRDLLQEQKRALEEVMERINKLG
ncbi:MAG: PadR family transcriptional regulator [Aquificota bacterium]|nr:MAG: PadR family transcriptional regulator [Aquificota bacterium]